MPIDRMAPTANWTRTGRRRTHRIAAGLAALALAAATGSVAIEGHPLVVRIQPDFDSYPQHFAIGRSSDGLLQLATAGGVAIFDGETWELVRLPAGQPARSLAATSDPILVGAYDDFGLLARGTNGEHRFTSLLAGFERPEPGPIGAVEQVLSHGAWRHFRTARAVYSWRPADNARRVLHEPAGVGPLAVLDEQLLLAVADQLVAFDPQTPPRPVADWPVGFRAIEAVSTAAGVLFRDGAHGFRRWDGQAWSTPLLGSSVDPSTPFIAMAALGDSWLALGTPLGEVVLVHEASGTERRLPLSDDRIDDLRADPAGAGLWALSHSELIRVDWPPRWETWGAADGLRGTVNRVVETGSETLLATSAGVLRAGERGPFELLDWATTEAWDLAAWPGGGWLVAESPRLTWLTAAGERREVGDSLTPRVLLTASGGGFWVGTNDGVVRVVPDAEGRPALTDHHPGATLIRSLAEDGDGRLWVGSIDSGVTRLDPASDALAPFAVGGETGGAASVSWADGAIWIAHDDAVLTWDGEALRPVEGLALPPMGGLDFTFRASEQADGTIWASNFRTVLRRHGDDWRPAQVEAHRRGAFNWVGDASDGGMWVGGTGALYRRRAPTEPVAGIGAATLLRAVSVGEDAGRFLPLDTAPPALPPRASLTFRFALPTFEGPAQTTYRTRLLGRTGNWSPWRAEATASFAGLPAGEYRFEVEARSGSGRVARAAAFPFSVTPTTLETPLGRAGVGAAVALFGFLAAIAVARLRTRRLLERNRALDALVHDRTAALEDANRRLKRLAERDGLTGIANRRVFEDELAAALESAAPDPPPLGLLMADADHFKRYNDTHGHLAGDQLLRDIAAIIDGLAADRGALAARYGGEEFAILVPGADRASLRALGEAIRQAVARETDATVSIGGALLGPGEGRQALVSAADAALYLAKDAGRNRVELSRTSA